MVIISYIFIFYTMNTLLLSLLIGATFFTQHNTSITLTSHSLPIESRKEILTHVPRIDAKSYIHADRIIFQGMDELEKYADFIGIIESDHDFKDQKHVNTYTAEWPIETFTTYSHVKVLETFQWELKAGDEIEMIELAGIVPINGEYHMLTIDGYEPIEKNKKYIVFLKNNPRGEWYVFNGNDSVFLQEIITDQTSVDLMSPDRAEIYHTLVKRGWIH